MMVGFRNMVTNVWEAEQPRAVFVGFDTVGTAPVGSAPLPTYRNELLPDYQGGRDFPPELTDQLDRLPALVTSLGFQWAKAPGFEADDFLAAAVSAEEDRGGDIPRPHERPRHVPAREREDDAAPSAPRRA